jgi:hypothetical protein
VIILECHQTQPTLQQAAARISQNDHIIIWLPFMTRKTPLDNDEIRAAASLSVKSRDTECHHLAATAGEPYNHPPPEIITTPHVTSYFQCMVSGNNFQGGGYRARPTADAVNRGSLPLAAPHFANNLFFSSKLVVSLLFLLTIYFLRQFVPKIFAILHRFKETFESNKKGTIE